MRGLARAMHGAVGRALATRACPGTTSRALVAWRCTTNRHRPSAQAGDECSFGSPSSPMIVVDHRRGYSSTPSSMGRSKSPPSMGRSKRRSSGDKVTPERSAKEERPTSERTSDGMVGKKKSDLRQRRASAVRSSENFVKGHTQAALKRYAREERSMMERSDEIDANMRSEKIKALRRRIAYLSGGGDPEAWKEDQPRRETADPRMMEKRSQHTKQKSMPKPDIYEKHFFGDGSFEEERPRRQRERGDPQRTEKNSPSHQRTKQKSMPTPDIYEKQFFDDDSFEEERLRRQRERGDPQKTEKSSPSQQRKKLKSKPKPFDEDVYEEDMFDERSLDEIERAVRRKEGKASPKKKEKKTRSKPWAAIPGDASLSVFASCVPGLEPLLLQEIQYLQGQWEQFLPPTVNKKRAKEQQKARSVRGGVKVLIPSPVHLHILHMYLGTASHIYLRLNDDDDMDAGIPPLFNARGFPELKRKLRELMISQRWDRWLLDASSLGSNGARGLRVHVTTSKSKLMHTGAVEERVRETMAEVLGIPVTSDGGGAAGRWGGGSGSEKDGGPPAVRLLVRIDRDEVQISLDTTSSPGGTGAAKVPLHARGYRLNPHKAPLREDLAFALAMAGGLTPRWDLGPLLRPLFGDDVRKSDAVDPANGDAMKEAAPASVGLFDPFCGSGTIAIEGCSILAGVPPGRLRPPPLRGTRLCDPKLWDAMRSQALGASSLSSLGPREVDDGDESREPSNIDTSKVLVAAGDSSQDAVAAATSNARRAGLDRLMDIRQGSFTRHPLFKTRGKGRFVFDLPLSSPLVVVTNPPYGKRLASAGTSGHTAYKRLAQLIFRLTPRKVRYALIGNDPRSLRESSLPLKVAFSTKQGGLNVVAMRGGVDDGDREGHRPHELLPKRKKRKKVRRG